MPTILLVRHAQASFGSVDYDVLSELGERQAGALGRELRRRGSPADVLRCGTHRRQRDTVKAFGDRTPDVDPGLDEYDSDGILATHARSPLRLHAAGPVADPSAASRAFQLVLDAGLRSWIDAGAASRAPESYPAFATRVQASLDDAAGRLSSGQTAVLCTSGGVISAACVHLLGVSEAAFLAFNRVAVNAGITTIAVGRSGQSLVSFNEHGHLQTGNGSLVSYR
ncbi:MAG TPA: histidine phosphatase family protein [Solirubrobacteraceae bacterium]|nr:histidine phosphatase family protein [Solirubrobacteraceae bacterium]